MRISNTKCSYSSKCAYLLQNVNYKVKYVYIKNLSKRVATAVGNQINVAKVQRKWMVLERVRLRI